VIEDGESGNEGTEACWLISREKEVVGSYIDRISSFAKTCVLSTFLHELGRPPGAHCSCEILHVRARNLLHHVVVAIVSGRSTASAAKYRIKRMTTASMVSCQALIPTQLGL